MNLTCYGRKISQKALKYYITVCQLSCSFQPIILTKKLCNLLLLNLEISISQSVQSEKSEIMFFALGKKETKRVRKGEEYEST